MFTINTFPTLEKDDKGKIKKDAKTGQPVIVKEAQILENVKFWELKQGNYNPGENSVTIRGQLCQADSVRAVSSTDPKTILETVNKAVESGADEILKQVSEKLKDANDLIETLNDKVSSLEGTVSEQKAEITALKTSRTAIKKTADDNKKKLAELEKAVGKLSKSDS